MSKAKNIVTEYRNYYLPLHFPVLLLTGDYWKISDVPSGRLHFHNCLEIGICHTDGGIMEFSGKPLVFQAGDVTCIPRNVPHTTYSHPGQESRWSYLFLDPEELFRNLLPDSWKNFDLSISSFQEYRHILGREEYPEIYSLSIQIIKELEEQKPGYQICCRGLLLSLYILLHRIQCLEFGLAEPSDTTPENALVISPALNYIEDNYMQPFSMEYLARLCHWSSTHFRRVFHEIMGTSPLEYVNNTRIMKSCNLIRSTEDSILSISESVGFHSVSSFNRYFSKVMQVSPREYRKQMLKKDKKMETLSILEYAGWMYPETSKT